MRRTIYTYRPIALLALLLCLGMSCSLPAQIQQTPVETPTQGPPPESTAVQPTLQEATRQAPAQEDTPDPLGEIQVDYVYTSNLITILYPLYGSTLDDFVVITIANSGAQPTQVLVESEIVGYTTRAVDTVQLDAHETLEVRQNPLLLPDAIEELNVEKPAQFHVKVAALQSGEQKLLLEETGETLVYARRDFPWSIPGFTDQEVFELIAAMVTPNDPSVEELIRKAAEYTESGMMWSGYGGHVDDDEGGVWERLEAIWQAEEADYDLTYISTWVSYAPGSVQRIRLPAEVLEQHSGNCIELAILYAAAAEAIDLEAAIVGVPGHAFVAVRTDQENANYYFIETTLIGQTSFADAVSYGNQEFEEASPHLDAGEESFLWVTIWNARENGILPLPWR